MDDRHPARAERTPVLPLWQARRGARARLAARFAFTALAALTLGLPEASAQPTARSAPTLRTPPPTAGAPGVPGGPGNPLGAPPIPPGGPVMTGAPGAAGAAAGAPGGTGAAGAPRPALPAGGVAQPAGADAAQGAEADPMAAVKQGMKEIEFRPKEGGALVAFNLDDADLPDLVKAISNMTGKRFIYGGKLRQIKATVYSPEKITRAEAYAAFLSILETNGMTVIPQGRFLKIVESPGIVAQTTPILSPATPVPAEDRYVTRLYRLTNIDATETATLLQKYKSKDGDITPYPGGNLLIITDTGTNIGRMLRIVEEIDVGGAGELLWVEPVHYGAASDVATKLNEILDIKSGGTGKGAGGARVGGPRIIADDRTNTLIVAATETDYRRLLELVKRLDAPQTGDGQIHVLPLQHAACQDLSNTLNQILGGGGGAAKAPRAGGKAGTPAVPGSAEDIFEGQIRVTCDEASNSLVTTSSLRDYAQLRGVIDKLDQPRRQVFIEAVVMDVNVDRSTDVGLGYHGGYPINDGEDGFLYGGNNVGQSVLGVPANLEALALGVRGPEIDGSQNIFGTGVSIPALGVVLHALAKDGDSNVLATPHILATDNVPAEISIGQNIPLQTNVGGSGLSSLAGLAGGSAGAAGAAGLAGGLGSLLGGAGFQAPRQDVGTKIKVVPHVNDSDQVRLELTEEISDAGSPTGALGAVPINKRTANTTLIVRDQQTVVIGGLVRDAVVNGETKIPILGDIPVLGALFRQTQKKTTKTNLLLILTPYVIRDQDDLRAIFERKMQERQEFLDRYFVFNETTDWEPPKDYARANGLVEEIRQAMRREEERRRLEEEARPKGPQTHEPQEPIAMPSVGRSGGGGGASGAVASGAETAGTDIPADPGGAPAVPRSKVRIPAARPAPAAPQRNVERVE